jgi:hypothetical protein
VRALAALARGQAAEARTVGRALAVHVLSSPDVLAALRVLAGGPHEDVRIAELCERAMEAASMPPTTFRESDAGAGSAGQSRTR